MAPTLISHIVRSALLPLRNALGQTKHHYSPEEVQELFDACAMAAILIDKLWGANGKLLDHGLEGSKLVCLLKEAKDTVEEALSAFAKVLEIATKETPSFEGKREGCAVLERAIQRTATVRSNLDSLLNWLSTPSPQVDPAALVRGEDSLTSEGYTNLDSLLDRLQAGGDV